MALEEGIGLSEQAARDLRRMYQEHRQLFMRGGRDKPEPRVVATVTSHHNWIEVTSVTLNTTADAYPAKVLDYGVASDIYTQAATCWLRFAHGLTPQLSHSYLARLQGPLPADGLSVYLYDDQAGSGAEVPDASLTVAGKVNLLNQDLGKGNKSFHGNVLLYQMDFAANDWYFKTGLEQADQPAPFISEGTAVSYLFGALTTVSQYGDGGELPPATLQRKLTLGRYGVYDGGTPIEEHPPANHDVLILQGANPRYAVAVVGTGTFLGGTITTGGLTFKGGLYISGTATGGGGGGHTIQDEGTPFSPRSNLNFTGAGVSVADDLANDRTNVTIAGGGGTVTSVTAGTGLTGTPNPIVGSGTVTLAVPVAATHGGTGQAAVAVGDLLYGISADVWSRRAIGAAGERLTAEGGVPVWRGARGCTVKLGSSHSIAHSVLAVAEFTDEVVDAEGMHDNVTNPSWVTVPEAGPWLVTGYMRWESDSTGFRAMFPMVNGETAGPVHGTNTVGDPAGQSCIAFVLNLNAGDVVQLGVFQNRAAGTMLSLLDAWMAVWRIP
jgi:hypothetical protein